MKRYVFLFGLYAIVMAGSCHSNNEKPEAEPEALLVTSPLVKDTIITKQYVCQIQAINHIELRSLESGYLQNIYVDEGKTVGKGQLLFRVQPNIYQAEYNKAAAETRVADIEVRNSQTLADKDIISKNELAMSKAKLEKARAEQALAQTHLGFTQIKAPFSGIVGRFHVRLGSLLEEGDLITELSDNSKMWVYFNMPEAEYLNYRMSDSAHSNKVQLLMANNRVFNQTGVVETVESDFNNETGNIAFRATFPNPDRLLRHGETGNILVEVPYDQAIIIPQKATFEILDKKYVFVVDGKKVVHSVPVTVIGEMPDLYIIGAGLKPNDKILLEGLRKVHDGQAIDFKYEGPGKWINTLSLPTQ